MDQVRLRAVIDRELARRHAEVTAVDPRLSELVDLLVRFVSDGGKRLRPEFLWCGWLAGCGAGPDTQGPDSEADPNVEAGVFTVAAGLELLQACALIHDDVIDRSERRRGGPSTHLAAAAIHTRAEMSGDAAHFGVSTAILLGDLALAWADDLFTIGAIERSAIDRAAPVWQGMRTEVLGGQLLDLLTTASAVTDPAVQAADALRVNRFKTAAYTVERPLHLGAALAGADQQTVDALRRYGADIGVAFQLRDDLLGVYGDPAVTGKPAGDDLVEGKRTMLLATARATLAASGKTADTALLTELDAGIGSTASDPARLAGIIADTGAVEVVEKKVTELVASGLAALDAVDPDGRPVVPAAARERLIMLADIATARRS